MRSVIAFAATTLAICSVLACSRQQEPPKPPAGTLVGGNAQIAIGTHRVELSNAVACRIEQAVTTANIADTGGNQPPATVSAVVKSSDSLVAQSVTIDAIDGFTGSFWHDAQGTAKITMVGQTYEIDGSAVGYDTKLPNQRVTRDFSVRFAC